MLDVFFFEAFEEEERALRRFFPENIRVGYAGKTIQESNCQASPAKIISVRTQSKIPTLWASDIAALLTRSTGFDHIADYLKASEKKIPSGYLPLYCNRAVAEQACLLWLALSRKLPAQIEQFERFHRDGITGAEAAQKNLLVVGVGNIGFEVVKIGSGLDMNVKGVDIQKKHPQVQYCDIEDGLAWADVIVCAMNLTEANRGYFNQKLLTRAKKGVIFVNIARGELSPPIDLLALIHSGRLGGLGLDVYDDESELAISLREGRQSDNENVKAVLRLKEFSNVILTPHNAFNTREAVLRKSEHSFMQIKKFLETGTFLWPVPE
jgi:D-lactate dehydrogenase